MTPGATMIETERLILRQHTREDLEIYTPFMASAHTHSNILTKNRIHTNQ